MFHEGVVAGGGDRGVVRGGSPRPLCFLAVALEQDLPLRGPLQSNALPTALVVPLVGVLVRRCDSAFFQVGKLVFGRLSDGILALGLVDVIGGGSVDGGEAHV